MGDSVRGGWRERLDVGAASRFVVPAGDAGAALLAACGDLGASEADVRRAAAAVARAAPGFRLGSTPLSFEGGGAAAVHVAAAAGAQGALDALGVLISEAGDAGGAGAGWADAARPDGATPLALAAAGGHAGCVARLLAAGAAVRPPRGLDGGACFNSPVAAAAQHGHVEVLRALLDHLGAAGGDADVDVDVTPLFGDDEGVFAEVRASLAAKDAAERAAAEDARRERAERSKVAAERHAAAYAEDKEKDEDKYKDRDKDKDTGKDDEEDGVIRDASDDEDDDGYVELLEDGRNPRRCTDSDESDGEDGDGVADRFRPQGVRTRPRRRWWPGRGPPGEGRVLAYPPTPLFWAAWSGHAPCVRLLLARGARADRVCLVIAAASTPLYVASASGHAEVVQALLEGGAGPGAALPPEGRFPLWRAAQYGHAACCALLLQAGADVDQRVGPDREYGGSTALWRAAQFGRVDVLRLLLASGADVSLATQSPPCDHAHTPVEVAAWSGQADALEVLLGAGGVPSAEAIYRARLMKRVSDAHLRCEAVLLAAGAPPEDDPWQLTPDQRRAAQDKDVPRAPTWPPDGRADLAHVPRDPSLPEDARVSLNPEADWF